MKKADLFVMKIIKIVAILLYTVLLILIFFPFFKGEILEYKLSNRTYKISDSIPLEGGGNDEAIVPPKFLDVLSFKEPSKNGIIGEIYYPRLAINLPIYSTVTNHNFMSGAVSLTPERDPLTENIIIMGHNFGNSHVLFSDVINSKSGDVLSINMMNHYYNYEVTETKIIKETDLGVLENSKGNQGQVTLITCDKGDFTDKRFVVRGVLKQNTPKQRLDVRKIIEVKTKKTKKRASKVLGVFLILLLTGYYFIHRIIRK